MCQLTNQRTQHAYEIKTVSTMDRIKLADAWEKIEPQNQDEILKISKGFLLKTNDENDDTLKLLTKLVSNKTITNYSSTNSHGPVRNNEHIRKESYSVVIHHMEYKIPDDLIKAHLESSRELLTDQPNSFELSLRMYKHSKTF